MYSTLSLATEIHRRRKHIEEREIFIDVMEHEGFDMASEIASIDRERELLARDIAKLESIKRG